MSIINNLSAIIALDVNNGFAKDGNIPWKSKTDMNFFKLETIGKTVIMGYNTLLSLPNSKPLKGRQNIIITNNKEKGKDYIQYDNILFFGFEETLDYINNNTNQDYIVIGGIQIIEIFLPYIKTLFLTRFKTDFNCDKFYPLNTNIFLKSVQLFEDDELTIQKLTKSL